MKKAIAAILSMSFILSATSCGSKEFQMSKIADDTGEFVINMFVEECKQNTNHENLLISPLSALCAIEMAENGAAGDTLSEISSIVHPNSTMSDVNGAVQGIMEYTHNGDEVKIANSAWINNKFASDIDNSYTKTLEDFYYAQVKVLDYSDSKSVDIINKYISENTDGMIDSALNSLDNSTAATLINVLAFDAEWQDKYKQSQVHDNEKFTNADGKSKRTTMLYEEIEQCLETKDADGFIKYYKDNKYAFFALLPHDEDIDSYIENFDYNKYKKFLASTTSDYDEIHTWLPEFSYDYETELSKSLKNLGISTAFDEYTADFSNMTQNRDFYLDKILQKTHIELDADGTKAAAVTLDLVANFGAAVEEPKKTKIIELNRPFIYGIIEKDSNYPLFLGVANDLGEEWGTKETDDNINTILK